MCGRRGMKAAASERPQTEEELTTPLLRSCAQFRQEPTARAHLTLLEPEALPDEEEPHQPDERQMASPWEDALVALPLSTCRGNSLDQESITVNGAVVRRGCRIEQVFYGLTDAAIECDREANAAAWFDRRGMPGCEGHLAPEFEQCGGAATACLPMRVAVPCYWRGTLLLRLKCSHELESPVLYGQLGKSGKLRLEGISAWV
eukprot:TRINITY_DN6276_c0_g1_i2.p1 TRINITY_DN6276_c0_g1~~TRINITY_DN6276_c0_g1_i2.p1  ORF type:complete len:203 (-),score=37.39 TRINITY_DN6276_c0_g1_i2:61-669(-)